MRDRDVSLISAPHHALHEPDPLAYLPPPDDITDVYIYKSVPDLPRKRMALQDEIKTAMSSVGLALSDDMLSRCKFL